VGWRKIRREDIRRGVIVRITRLSDTCYNGATIVGVDGEIAYLSRPYIYAHEHFDSTKGGLTGVETFSVFLDSMCREGTDIEVYESEHYSNKGEVRSMLT